MEALIASLGRTSRQRTTLYGDAPPSRRHAAHRAPGLQPLVLEPHRRERAAAAG
jgi:FO synthase